MILLAAIGKQSSGKGELANLAKSKGFEILKFRDMVSLEAAKRKIDKGALTLTYTGDLLRKELGPEWVAKRIEEKIKKSKSQKIFLEGMRSLAELNYLREKFSNLKVIGVAAEEEKRLQRALKRNRQDDPKTLEEKLRKEKIENSWGIEEGLKQADYLIENSGTIGEFRKLSEEVIEKCLKLK